MPGWSSWNDAESEKIASPCWIATTRRVLNERPSRMRSTSYTIGTDGSPGRMKYECSECTGRSGSTVRPAATKAWPATCPPNTRCHSAFGLRPRKMFSSMRSRSSSRTSPSTVCWPSTATSDVMTQYVADVMHPDRVGGTWSRRRSARNDDHEVARPAYAAVDQCRVDLTHHVVGRLHRPDEMRLGTPQQRELTLYLLDRREHEDALRRLQAGQPPRRVSGLGERHERDRAERIADVLRRLDDRAARSARHMLQPPHIRAGRLDGRDDPTHRRDCQHRVLADARLTRQHHRVGAVDDGVRDIGRLGARGTRVRDHRLEHLRRDAD